MPFGESKIPTTASVPPPTYQETVKQNEDLNKQRAFSMERAMLYQNTLGKSQLVAGGAGLKLS